MVLKVTTSKTSLLSEGSHEATLSSIEGRPDKINPKKVVLGFKVKGHETEVFKELSPSFDSGKPLRKDAETILGHELTASEAEAGFDMDKLINTPCEVVVMHKAGVGGRIEAAVSLVQKAK